MKKIAVIYRNKKNGDIIKFLNENLIEIFQGYVELKCYYGDELIPGEKINADAYLVVHEKMIYELKDNISNYSKVVLLKRSVRKDVLDKLSVIPKDTEVYVVNDSYDTEIETINMFCELGVTDYLWKPYSVTNGEAKESFASDYFITPGELDLVPNSAHVIDIGYRNIGFETLFSLMRKLDLDNDVINRNILRYSHDLIEPNTDYHENHYENCLKGQLLNMVVDESISAIIVFNNKMEIVYFNEKAESLFKLDQQDEFDLIDESLINQESDYKSYPMVVGGDNYIVDKSTVRLIDETIGYIVTLRNEKTLRDLEATLKNSIVKKGLFAKYNFNDIIYESDSMKKCISTAKEAAETDNTIIIYGESGTGKELLAQSIHNFSNRRKGPFVAVNCAAIPESLIESELFGYEKGSFTGAKKNGKIGYFEQAHGGTLFLDEIGNISFNFQKVLLRAIQERQIIRIGGDQVINVDVRIIAATNADLRLEVAEKRFRDDLYYRLNVIPITIAPLKYRQADILPLFNSFLGKSYQQVTQKEKDDLLRYDWPGNIRELQNAAIYYKTLGRFPDYLYNRESSRFDEVESEQKTSLLKASEFSIEENILMIIAEKAEMFHGIGRATLISELDLIGIRISDGKLRGVLHKMQDNGLVLIKKGRAGTSLTEKGMNKLKQYD